MLTDHQDVYKGLPRRIAVGGFTFRVVVASERHEHLRSNDGMCVFDEQRIYLRSSLTRALAVNTVQHEISHAINWVYGVTDDSTEEQFTNQHTNGLTEVWVRNPRLFDWIGQQLQQLRKDNRD